MKFEKFQHIPPPPPVELREEPDSVLKERDIEDLSDFSVREYSKEKMTEERSSLAAEILEKRNEERRKIEDLKMRIQDLTEKLAEATQGHEFAQAELENVETEQVKHTNSLAGKFKSFVGLETSKDKALQDSIEEQKSHIELSMVEKDVIAAELEENMNQLIDVGTALKSLRGEIDSHYEGASEVLDKMQRSVEQTMMRNQAFVVHTINEWDELRHNDNSNVSKEASFEDDLDIMLSLEPSISASTVLPGTNEQGKVSGLWSHTGGLLLAGGSISEAYRSDGGTRSLGIKIRTGKYSDNVEATVETLDEVIVNHRYAEPEKPGGYNEIVVNNPEAAGYFKEGAIDENGIFWAYGLGMKESFERMHAAYQKSPDGFDYRLESSDFDRNLKRYRNRFDLIRKKGLPFYSMTPDRRFFEVLKVNDNGTLQVGGELRPEQAAKGKAGLLPDQRKEIGHKLLQKEVFRDGGTNQEAQQIIEEL